MSKRSQIPYETKMHVVMRCLQHKTNPNFEAKQLKMGPNTVREWIRKYQIWSASVLRKWISKYTNGIEQKPHRRGKGVSPMNKGHRKRYYRIMSALELKFVMSHSNNNELMINTVKKAYAKNPGTRPLLHSDRGFQYTSHEYHRL